MSSSEALLVSLCPCQTIYRIIFFSNAMLYYEQVRVDAFSSKILTASVNKLIFKSLAITAQLYLTMTSINLQVSFFLLKIDA